MSESNEQGTERALDLFRTWQYVTAALIAISEHPDAMDGTFDGAKQQAAGWTQEHRERVKARAVSGELTAWFFNPEMVRKYRAAYLEAMREHEGLPEVDLGE